MSKPVLEQESAMKTAVGQQRQISSALSLSKTLELARTFGMISDQAKKMAFYRKLKGRDSRRTYPENA